MSIFRFRQFTIQQGNCAMKVGTDALLLGAWAATTPHQAQRILDIGTGTGILALMVAQRSHAHTHIDAVEIDPAAAQQAADNVARSPWIHQIQVHATDIQQFAARTAPHSYDMVVSNPPYFAHALPSPNATRNYARHTDTLALEQLLHLTQQLLTPAIGRLCVVLPTDTAWAMVPLARLYGLHLSQQCEVHTRSHKPAKRMLLELHTTAPKQPPTPQPLVIAQPDGSYTPQYRQLTQAYHTIFE